MQDHLSSETTGYKNSRDHLHVYEPGSGTKTSTQHHLHKKKLEFEASIAVLLHHRCRGPPRFVLLELLQ
jgi:hypothetical protein